MLRPRCTLALMGTDEGRSNDVKLLRVYRVVVVGLTARGLATAMVKQAASHQNAIPSLQRR